MKRDARALGAYALLALLLTWPLAAHLTTAVPGLPGDNWQQYWNVWWVKRALLELHQSPYHTPALFHPAGADLHFNLSAQQGYAVVGDRREVVEVQLINHAGIGRRGAAAVGGF